MDFEDMDAKQRREYRKGESAFHEGKSIEDLCGAMTSKQSDIFMEGYYAAQEELRIEQQNEL